MLSIQGSSKHQGGGKCVSGLRVVSIAAATESETKNDGKAAGNGGVSGGNGGGGGGGGGGWL